MWLGFRNQEEENTQHWMSSEFEQERTVFSGVEHFSFNQVINNFKSCL